MYCQPSAYKNLNFCLLRNQEEQCGGLGPAFLTGEHETALSSRCPFGREAHSPACPSLRPALLSTLGFPTPSPLAPARLLKAFKYLSVGAGGSLRTEGLLPLCPSPSPAAAPLYLRAELHFPASLPSGFLWVWPGRGSSEERSQGTSPPCCALSIRHAPPWPQAIPGSSPRRPLASGLR